MSAIDYQTVRHPILYCVGKDGPLFSVQIAVDQAGAGTPANIGWAIQYVPAGASPQALTFNQTTSGDLCNSNQFILGAGIFQTNNAPNSFYARGHVMNDGDQIFLSVQPLSAVTTTELNALINYGMSTK